MIKYENECVCCAPEMGCMGVTCPNREVPHRYCDKCGEEIVGNLYGDSDYDDLCKNCYEELHGEVED